MSGCAVTVISLPTAAVRLSLAVPPVSVSIVISTGRLNLASSVIPSFGTQNVYSLSDDTSSSSANQPTKSYPSSGVAVTVISSPGAAFSLPPLAAPFSPAVTVTVVFSAGILKLYTECG